METRTETIENGKDFVQNCTIEHQGHSFTNGGAYRVGDRVFAYVHHSDESAPKKYGPFQGCQISVAITRWDGEILGHGAAGPRRFFRTPGCCERSYRRWINATIDERKYRGWYFESSGDYCRLKAYAAA